MSWQFTTTHPFNLEAVIDAHGWVQLAPFAALPHSSGFEYTFVPDVPDVPDGNTRAIPCRITPIDQGIHVTTSLEVTPSEARALQTAAQWMVGFAVDLSAFYDHARAEPRLAHVEKGAKGRLLRAATVYEDLIKTILTTNTTWSGTIRMNAALVDAYGLPAADGSRAFPLPASLAAAHPDELRAQAKLGYRAPYIVELSQAVATGDLDLESLKDPALTTDEVRKFLLSIKGVGDYAAANMLLLLGHHDFVPVDSYAVKNVGKQWHGGARVGPKEIYAAFDQWRPYRGLAYWFWQWDE